jgi:hypothetical protein
LNYQARDLVKAQLARQPEAGQRIREFHPQFKGASDTEIFSAKLSLSAAQLAIAREYGFTSWSRLKAFVEKANSPNRQNLPLHERIDSPELRRAVQLLDAGDVAGLRGYVKRHPDVVGQRAHFEGGNYCRRPTLLEFIAENPVRHGTLPANILAIAQVILEARPGVSVLNDTLALVCSGCVPRECRVQLPLIDLLCDSGADPGPAIHPAVVHGEFEAVHALIRRGARIDLPVAAALGSDDVFTQLLPKASSEDRQRALALATQFGRLRIVKTLLEFGEDPNRYNPVGFHSHATPLHQAALGGQAQLVQLLIEHGARIDTKDILWQGTAADWAHYAGQAELETYLRGLEVAGQPD